MSDIVEVIRVHAANGWLYLPVAVVLGALHAFEPGHAKSLMAAYIVAIRGTARQAVILALSAAVGHTIVVWILVLAVFLVGERYIVEQAEPWLMMLSGILVILLAARMLLSAGHKHSHAHGHHHHDGHHHHGHDHGHSHAVPDRPITRFEIAWFGFTGGLLPCPAAIAVLLICIQLKVFVLGIAMVAAFSLGLALTLVLIGVSVAWGAERAMGRWPGLNRIAERLPFLSGALVLVVGIIMAFTGYSGIGAASARR
jgi:nickel/cobalt exporter